MNQNPSKTTSDIVQLSQDFLLAIRMQEDAESLAHALEVFDPQEFKKQVDSDDKKRAFWLNIYNAFIQWLLQKDEKIYEKRHNLYTLKAIHIAGKKLSFEDIEHGLLRRSQNKYGYGYISNPLASAWEKAHRVKNKDAKIHFALNCGAASCPPIAFYKADQIQEQLEMATRSYLEHEATYIAQTNVINLPRIMLWFIGDFGGYAGLRRFLKKYKVITEDQKPRIKFKEYDWSLSLANYS